MFMNKRIENEAFCSCLICTIHYKAILILAKNDQLIRMTDKSDQLLVPSPYINIACNLTATKAM